MIKMIYHKEKKMLNTGKNFPCVSKVQVKLIEETRVNSLKHIFQSLQQNDSPEMPMVKRKNEQKKTD